MKEKNKEKEKIVLENEKIINGVLKEKHLSFMKDELYDICMIGFVNGMNTYDEAKGTKLKTYIANCIKTEIAKYFYIQNMKKRQAKVISYNVIVDGHGDTEMIELIADDYDLEKDILLREDNRQLYMAIQTLPRKKREILCYAYGTFGFPKKTNEQIGKKYNISKNQVEKIKIDSKNRLRMILKNECFAKYIEQNYERFLEGTNKEIIKQEIILENNLDFRQKEYLLKSLKTNWKEKNNEII